MRRFWRDFKQAWEELAIEAQEVRLAGDEVVALYDFRARARAGPPVRRAGANVFRVENGRVVGITAYGAWDEALSAVRT